MQGCVIHLFLYVCVVDYRQVCVIKMVCVVHVLYVCGVLVIGRCA
jgi:hypothetical protein